MSTDQQRFIAMVACRQHHVLKANNIADLIKSMFPEISDEIGVPPDEELDTGGFVIPIGDATIIVMQLAFPIPTETLEWAIDSELMWKDASQSFASSKAHIIVSVIAPSEDPRFARQLAKKLSYATAAIVKETKALGVYWSTAEAVIEPQRFASEVTKAGVKGYPTDLWVTFRFAPGPNFKNDDSIIARTSGLDVFVGREVECGPYTRQPGDLAQNVLAVARYVIETGEGLVHGHLIGDEGAVDAKISLERSEYDDGKQAIYRLIFV